MINSPQNAPATQVNKTKPAFAPSYNAVQINLDTPTLNAPPAGYYYDYPQADGQPYYPPMPAPAPAPAQDPKVPAPVPEQTPATDAKPSETPEVNIDEVLANLASNDFDKQAVQMEQIAQKGLKNEADAVPYVQEDVINKLIDIINTDSSNLDGPTENQLQLRAKVAENDAVIEQAVKEGKDIKTVQLPHQLTPEEEQLATTITPLEQAERNKEYALFTTAILQKTYADEIEKRSGNVVPLTDLPGAAQVVEELKGNQNPAIRVAAIDALRFVQRPEYKDDLAKIYSIAQTDADDTVSAAAADALKSLEQPQDSAQPAEQPAQPAAEATKA